MQLHLLGSTGYHPNEERHTTCLMLPEIGLVFDAGTAMFRVRDLIATDTLDIFLTHGHLDHVVGLTFMFDILWEKEMQRVAVHGVAEKLEALDRHLFSEVLFPVKPPFDWVPLESELAVGAGGKLSFFPLQHPGGAIGYRIDWPDRSLAFVTDTTADPEADYVRAIQGVDLLVHECNFADGWEEQAQLTGHSCTTPVAEVARRAKVGRLVLSHLNPLITAADPVGLATARAIFPNTEIARDNMRIDF